MNRKHFLYNDWRAEEEPDEDEKEETPKSDLMMFSKKLEKYFFESRSMSARIPFFITPNSVCLPTARAPFRVEAFSKLQVFRPAACMARSSS